MRKMAFLYLGSLMISVDLFRRKFSTRFFSSTILEGGIWWEGIGVGFSETFAFCLLICSSPIAACFAIVLVVRCNQVVNEGELPF